MTDNSTELLFEYHKSQALFAHFLLGVAASAIAFAIHETSGLALVDAPWPLGVAVALWAVSFALGCFGLEARQVGIHTNALFLQTFGDVPARNAPPETAAVLERVMNTVRKDLAKPVARFRWQQWTLFVGAGFYIAGHVMQMAALPHKAVLTAKHEATAQQGTAASGGR